MSPLHRNLNRLVAELAREKQNLRIESPALNSLLRKDSLCSSALECFETALRIREMQAQCNPQSQIKKPSENLPMNGLPLRLQFGIQQARSDGDISAFIQWLK